MDYEVMRQHQATSLDRINKIIEGAEREIAALDPELRDEVVRERAEQIKARSMDALAAERAHLQRRAADAEVAERRHEPAALRRHARFHEEPHADATMRLATFATLERSSLADLIVHLEDAVEGHNLALAEAVRLEFARRPEVPPETTAEFGRVMNRLAYPSAETLAKLREVRGSASMADVRISEFLRGQSNPAGRISAARKMGVAA